MEKPIELNLSLCGWIIRDYRQDDFEVGHEYTFSLNLYIKTAEIVSTGSESFEEFGFGEYRFSGRTLLSHPEVEIFDVGIRCYRVLEPVGTSKPKVGGYFKGTGNFVIDEGLHCESEENELTNANLEYRWRVKKIWMTGPQIKPAPRQKTKRLFKINRIPTEYEDIQRTDGRNDFGGLASYYLRCECLGLAT